MLRNIVHKLNKNEKGFTVVEIILVIIAIGLLAVVGWFVYNNQKKQVSTVTTSTNKALKLPVNQSTSEYSGWQTYTGHGFTIKYPSQWKSFDSDPSRTDLSLLIFGTHPVEAGGGYKPGTSAFEVSVHHKGYKICDCNPTEYVDEDTDLTHFVRSMNGLMPDSVFKDAVQHTKTIGSYQAISYSTSTGFASDWTLRVGSNFYVFRQHEGDDIDKSTQQADFEKFLTSFGVN